MKLSIICTLLATLFSAISAVPNVNERETNAKVIDLNLFICQQVCYAGYNQGDSLDELRYCLNKCEEKRGRKLGELDSNKPRLASRPPDIPPVPRDIACQHDCLNSSSTPLEYVECKRGCPKSPDSSNRDDARITPSVREEIPTRPDYICIIRCFQRSTSSSNEVNKCITNECGGRGTEIAVEANAQKGSNSVPESHRQLFTLPDDDSWGSIPPDVRCHVACYEFAANNEKFQECNRDCLSEPSNESEIAAIETGDKNKSEKKSNDLSGSQRQLISEPSNDWDIPSDVACQLRQMISGALNDHSYTSDEACQLACLSDAYLVACFNGTPNGETYNQCTGDCLSQSDDREEVETHEKKSRNLRGSESNL